MKKTIKIIILILILLIANIKDVKAKELPKVFLEGNINKMETKDDERKIKLHFISNNLEFIAYAKIKLQDDSNLSYDKQSYDIALYEDSEYSNKKKVDVGQNWGKQHNYYLKANWIDKTHSRNIVTSNIISDIQKKYNLFTENPNNGSIDGFPIEIYHNNKFIGLYTWNMPKDNWTFNMDNDNPNHIVFSSTNKNNTTLFKEEATYDTWKLEIGTENKETLIKFNRLINFIKDSTNTEFKNEFSNYLSLDATLNYYIMLHFAALTNNTFNNMLLTTYDGEIWSPILYDLDSSWGTNLTGDSTIKYNVNIIEDSSESLLWKKFQENFSNEIANRYFELRKEILTKNNIINKFNKFYQSIPKTTLIKEQNKWKNIPGYSISQIEDFLDTRIPIADHKMHKLYNITPQINIEYSTKENTLKPVTVTLIPNRKDIIITKNGKKSYDYIYTFKENGKYTFEYEDWYGNNLGTITININCIKIKLLINTCITVITIITIIAIYIKKKKELNNPNEIKNNSSKEKTNSKNSTSPQKTNSKNNNSAKKILKKRKKKKLKVH